MAPAPVVFLPRAHATRTMVVALVVVLLLWSTTIVVPRPGYLRLVAKIGQAINVIRGILIITSVILPRRVVLIRKFGHRPLAEPQMVRAHVSKK